MNAEQVENLSRYLDGDFTQEELRQLEKELESDSALRQELEAMQALRDAVSALATREVPPAELDSLVEPLRRARPKQILVRPAYRWLAAAASVVFAVSIGVELSRRPTLKNGFETGQRADSAKDAQTTKTRTYFQLQPMPRFEGEDEAPLGAAERLLATPLAFPEPDGQPALEVIGPLPEPPEEGVPFRVGKAEEVDSELRDARQRESEHPSGTSSDGAAPLRRVEVAIEEFSAEARPTPETIVARIQFAGMQTWHDIKVPSDTPVGLYELRLDVEGDRILGILAIESGPSVAESTRKALETAVRDLSLSAQVGSHATQVILEIEARQSHPSN
ncbi:MAG: hypothetical protein GY906_25560 [bacterium]|nr:hypothetical protein [bacterium]